MDAVFVFEHILHSGDSSTHPITALSHVFHLFLTQLLHFSGVANTWAQHIEQKMQNILKILSSVKPNYFDLMLCCHTQTLPMSSLG